MSTLKELTADTIRDGSAALSRRRAMREAERAGDSAAADVATALERMLAIFDTPPGQGLPGAEQETCAFAREVLARYRAVS